MQAIERIERTLSGVTLEDFKRDWEKYWLVERGLEIISEASRHLPDDLKHRQPSIPWSKVAGIGNILRHDYDRTAPDILWKIAQADLPMLGRICREELMRSLRHESAQTPSGTV